MLIKEFGVKNEEVIVLLHSGGLSQWNSCPDHAVDNPRSGKVMEKCGLEFDHYGEYTKLDGSPKFKAEL